MAPLKTPNSYSSLKENTAGSIMLPGFKLYCKAVRHDCVVLDTDTHINQWARRERLEINHTVMVT